MSPKKVTSLVGTEGSEDLRYVGNGEWRQAAVSAELPEVGALNTQLHAQALNLRDAGSRILGEMFGVDAGQLPVIHNVFWVPGKVPSLNDLLDAKGTRQPIIRSIIMRQRPAKGNRRGGEFDLYNDIKQDWKQRTIAAIGAPFVRVQSAYFGYLVVEAERRRDPSNICSAAIKFIEDGIVEAGVMPNDGWDQVLGIRTHWIHRVGCEPGVFVVMSDRALPETELIIRWMAHV
jgi:hypothetical protein